MFYSNLYKISLYDLAHFHICAKFSVFCLCILVQSKPRDVSAVLRAQNTHTYTTLGGCISFTDTSVHNVYLDNI